MEAAPSDLKPSASCTSVPALEHADSWPWDSLSRSTAAVLATLCALTFLLLPAAVSWQRQQQARCGGHQYPAARLDEAAARRETELPDNATFAICVIMNVPADDPQWVDGRAEDVHEVCCCRPGVRSSGPGQDPAVSSQPCSTSWVRPCLRMPEEP